MVGQGGGLEESYRGQEVKGEYKRNNSFFKSNNVDCLNISLSLNGPHIFAGRIHSLKHKREKILHNNTFMFIYHWSFSFFFFTTLFP